MATREEWALRLIGEGFCVFPLQPGKKTPFSGIGWKALKSRDPSVVREWFRKYPDMNYAVVCDDEHVIIDLDNGYHTKNGVLKEGEKNFREAEDVDGGFPEESALESTFKVRSPKGGYHLYFKCSRPYQISASKIIQDVDVRSRDGYVLGPGCHTDDHPDENTVEGTYEVVLNKPMVHVPEWLEKRLDGAGLSAERAENAGTEAMPVDLPEAIKQAQQWLTERDPAIQGHGGNDHTYATAQIIMDLGVSPEKCIEIMLDSEWNTRCEPAWDYKELEVLVHNAARYRNRQIGSKGDALAAIGEPTPEQAGIQLAEGEHFSAVPQPIGKEEPSKLRELFFKHSAFVARVNDYDFLIDEWLPTSGVTGLIGKYGSGKSVIMTDIACRVACDMTWNDKDIVPGYGVLYLAGEDDIGIQRMMQAWTNANDGIVPSDERLLIATGVPNLLSGSEVQKYAEIAKEHFGNRPVLTILDTWQRASSSGSQNDDKDMQLAFANAEGIGKAMNGPVLASFHPPKNKNDDETKTVMGSSVIDNSTKGLWHLGEDAGSRFIKTGRIKGAPENNRYVFEITRVPLPGVTLKDGKIASGIVAHRLGGSGGNSFEYDQKVKRIRLAVAEAIEQTLIDKTNHSLTYKEVAEIIYSMVAGKTSENSNDELVKAFYRAENAEDTAAMLHKLFTPSTRVDLTGICHLVIEGGKFILSGTVL